MFYQHGLSSAIDNAWEHACQQEEEKGLVFLCRKPWCLSGISKKAVMRRTISAFQTLYLKKKKCSGCTWQIFKVFISQSVEWRFSIPRSSSSFPHSSLIRESRRMSQTFTIQMKNWNQGAWVWALEGPQPPKDNGLLRTGSQSWNAIYFWNCLLFYKKMRLKHSCSWTWESFDLNTILSLKAASVGL